ncbi:hypothetical protein FT663_04551 [Candidozyma haemuli var. vulneris]|nr:hypothetical protein FT662_04572 [[Candida] haemuloni var. vulneris]KAF3987199.1 hypothetical protein FT663_04551 [[Candida] haemuloni var. vulneris]
MTSIISPGEGFTGFLHLGISLYDTVAKLRASDYKMKIAYSSRKYLESPILVTLPSLGLRLTFSSSSGQELRLIEVMNFEMLKLSYNGQALNEIQFYEAPEPEDALEKPPLQKSVVPPCLKVIYNKIFGPTYPGILDLEKKTYVLSYPGISFKFVIRSKELLAKLSSIEDDNQILSKLANWDVAPDIACQSLAIFSGKDFTSFLDDLKKETVSRAAEASSIEKFIVTLETGDIEVAFFNNNGAARPKENLKLGVSTQQDVLRILGPPDAYFNKFDSRLLIHKHLKTATAAPCERVGSVYKFHNYFRLGIDLLYNLNPNEKVGGVLEKVVLHNGGIVESLDFMQWNKCNWKIRWNAQSKSAVDSSLYFHEFSSSFLKEISTHKTDPVLLNRNESEITRDEDLEILHVTENGKSDLSTQMSSTESIGSKPSNEFKTWGQSRLFGYDRCIWEVIESNNCVSNVTIY